jgi:ATP-dependent DNA helicase 2 subunit 2
MMGDEAGYEHISQIQPIKQILMSDIRYLRDELRPSKTNTGDALSAIVVAIQMIVKHCKQLKFKRFITLVTDGMGSMDADDLTEITSKMKQDGIVLTILGVDFDDAEFGFKEENKNPIKAQNEQVLRELTEACDGNFGTVAAAVSELGLPEVKTTRPVNLYRDGILTLGDPGRYDTAMVINVERYPRVRVAPAPTASSFVVRSDMAAGASSTQTSATIQNGEEDHARNEDGLAAVKNARTYQVEDPSAPGGKKDVDREELAKGYEYGRTAVHISESDSNVVKMDTTLCMDIIGFVEKGKYERFMSMTPSDMVIANKTNDKAKMALSSFIHALHELDTYAIARHVNKDGAIPLLLLLAPQIDPDSEYLISVELPFAEDVRSYIFPPLDKVVTVGGKKLTQHRLLPSDDLMKSMSDYVDAIDISTFSTDEDGNNEEYAAMEDTYSPKLNRIMQAIKFRAVNATDEVPEPLEILTRFSNPPSELLKRAENALDGLIIAGDVKKVPPKQKGRKRAREVDKPLSGLNIEELLGAEKRVKISADNAVPEFKQLLNATEDINDIKEATSQMDAIIQRYIQHSVGDSGYGRAIEAIRVMKEEMTEYEFPDIYNDILTALKKKILSGQLGGDRKELWYQIKVHRLGLIDSNACGVSKVSPDEAKAVRFFVVDTVKILY